MRRKTAKRLANLGRLAALSVCALGGATAYVWQDPALVDYGEFRLRRRLTKEVQYRWQRAEAETDPVAQRAAIVGIVEDLAHVQRQDHQASILRGAYPRLVALAEARGDVAEALRWQRDYAAFDDHDLRVQVKLGELLCRQPATTEEGLTHLAGFAKSFPGHPQVVAELARGLANAGRPEQAVQVLETTVAEPPANLWLVYWYTDKWSPVRYAYHLPTSSEGHLRLRFDLAERCNFVRFVLPRFAGMRLVQPRLTVVAGGQVKVVDLVDPQTQLREIVRGPGHLDVLGHYHAQLDIPLPELPAGTFEIALTAEVQPRLSHPAATPAAGVPLRLYRDQLAAKGELEACRRLQQWRDAAYHGRPMDLYWRTGKESFSAKQRVSTTLVSPGDGTVHAVYPVGSTVSQLRIDLPPDARGMECNLRRVVLLTEGKEVAVDLKDVKLLGTFDVERTDGRYVATGIDPHFWFACPVPTRVDSVRLEGDA